MSEEEADRAWNNMWVTYHKMGLSEGEIAKRIICKTTKAIEGKKGLGECDK